jgi:uncharacterized membrane protein YeaQ/YmgE (transglycosylase-associated protein family)
MSGVADPLVSLLIVVVIGVLAGVIYDRFAGPGWLTRQVAGARRGIVTSSLIGVAGSFIGFNLAALGRMSAGGITHYVGAAVGAALVLWLWRIVR